MNLSSFQDISHALSFKDDHSREANHVMTKQDCLKLTFAIVSTALYVSTVVQHFDQELRHDFHKGIKSALLVDQLEQVSSVNDFWEWTTQFSHSLLPTGAEGHSERFEPQSPTALSNAIRSGMQHLASYDENDVPEGFPNSVRKDRCFLEMHNRVIGGVAFTQKRRQLIPGSTQSSDGLWRTYGGVFDTGTDVKADVHPDYKAVRDFVDFLNDEYDVEISSAKDSHDAHAGRGPSLKINDPRIFEQCWTEELIEAQNELSSSKPTTFTAKELKHMDGSEGLQPDTEHCTSSLQMYFDAGRVEVARDFLKGKNNITNSVVLSIQPFGKAYGEEETNHKTKVHLLDIQMRLLVEHKPASDWIRITGDPLSQQPYDLVVDETFVPEDRSYCTSGCLAQRKCGALENDDYKDLLECQKKCKTDLIFSVEILCWDDNYNYHFGSFPDYCGGKLKDSFVERCTPGNNIQFDGQLTFSTMEEFAESEIKAELWYDGEGRSVEASIPNLWLQTQWVSEFEHAILGMLSDTSDKDIGIEMTLSGVTRHHDGKVQFDCHEYTVGGIVNWRMEIGIQDLSEDEGVSLTLQGGDAICVKYNPWGTCLTDIEQPVVVSLMDPQIVKKGMALVYPIPPCNAAESFACHHYWATPHQTRARACQIVFEEQYQDLFVRHVSRTKSKAVTEHWKNLLFSCNQHAAYLPNFVHLQSPFDRKSQGFSHMLDCSEEREAKELVISFLRLMLLKEEEWVDSFTSEVEVLLVVYNANHHLIGLVTVRFDFTTTGHVLATSFVHSASVDYFPADHKSEWVIRTITEVVFLITVLMSTVSEVFESKFWVWNGGRAEGIRNYVSSWVNLFDIARIALAYALMVIWLQIIIKSDQLRSSTASHLTAYHDDSDTLFVSDTIINPLRSDIEDLISLEATYKSLAGLELLIFTIWLLKYFKHPRVAVVTNTLSDTAGDLIHFLLVFVVIVFVYASIGTVYFGQDLAMYSSVPVSFVTSLRMLFGDFEYDDLYHISAGGTFVFFWSFQLIAFLVMFNIVLAIVVNAYTKYQEQLSAMDPQPNLFYDVARFFVKRAENVEEAMFHPEVSSEYNVLGSPSESSMRKRVGHKGNEGDDESGRIDVEDGHGAEKDSRDRKGKQRQQESDSSDDYRSKTRHRNGRSGRSEKRNEKRRKDRSKRSDSDSDSDSVGASTSGASKKTRDGHGYGSKKPKKGFWNR